MRLITSKAVEEKLDIAVIGEMGKDGRPLKKGNPYLEIDLIDPTDPILFEGSV